MTTHPGRHRQPTNTALTVACGIRAGWGLLLIANPGRVLRAGGGHDDRVSRGVVRVLGVRHLVQAAAVAARPTPGAQAAGVAVDVLHGSSALAFAAVDQRQRRFALGEAALAALGATVGLYERNRHR
jgi:hypothetical protein